jgi:AsmA protein
MKPGKQPANKQVASSSTIKQAILGLYGIIGVAISTFGPFKVPFAESHAKEYWRHALVGIVLLLTLLGGIVGLAVYLFEANYFKSQMVDYVKDHYQRDLTLEGDIKVTFFPQLGLDSGKMTLSQRNSNASFASIENARFYLAWLPLLRKQLLIEHVTLNGVHANLIRYKDSTTNIDDLLTTNANISDIKFEFDSLKLKNSSVNLQDEKAELYFSLHDVNIETGRVSDASPSDLSATFRLESNKPRIDTKVKLSSHILFELKTGHYEFSNFEVKFEGEAPNITNLDLTLQGTFNNFPTSETLKLDKFSAILKGKVGSRKLDAKIDIPQLQGIKNSYTGKIASASATLSQDEENITVSMELPNFSIASNAIQADNMSAQVDVFHTGSTLQGKISSPVKYDFSASQLQLPTIVGAVNGSHSLFSAKVGSSMTGNLVSNLADKNLKLNLNAKIDESNLTASVSIQDFLHPVYEFDLQADTIDLNRYLAIDWSKRLQDDTLPFDLNGLKNINMRGKLRSGEFKIGKIKASNLQTEIKLDQAVLTLDPFNTSLYGGIAQGSLSIAALENPKFTITQKLTGMQLHKLHNDLTTDEAMLIGKANLILDLNATGTDMAGIRKTLNGKINLAIGHGSLAGLNLTDKLLADKHQLGVESHIQHERAKFTEKTQFSELKSNIEIKEGNAHSNDFLIKSSLYTSKGEGNLVLDSGQFDVQLNTTLSPDLKRSIQGALAEMKGITIPMRIYGNAAAPLISLDYGHANGGNLSKLLKESAAKSIPEETVVRKPLKK